MKVTKRDGSVEPVCLQAIQDRIQSMCNIDPQLESVDVARISQKVVSGLTDMIQTSILDKIASECCMEYYSVSEEYEKLAVRLLIDDMYRNVKDMKMYDFYSLGTTVSAEFLEKLSSHTDIEKHINRSFDNKFSFFGLQTLINNKYLLRTSSGIVEPPAYMYMRVSISLSRDNSIDDILSRFESLRNQLYTHATPTLFNAGSNYQQFASCFLLSLQEDSVDGIYDSLKECAQISKYAGGIGIHMHNLRAAGSIIKSTGCKAEGLLPVLKLYNESSKLVKQSGKRPGSIAIYMSPDHADIESFIDMRRNYGDDSKKCRDLFSALWIPDMFMRAVESNSEWHLFSPDTAPGLADVFGEEYEKLYYKYVSEGKFVKIISAQSLFQKIISAQIETGTPYMTYKDAANCHNNQSNVGVIKSSNLCSEIMQYSDADTTAVCNLCSICLPRFVSSCGSFDFSQLKMVVRTAVCSLDNVIDTTMYPNEKTRKSNIDMRPIGIGVQGWHNTLFALGLDFDSAEAMALNKKIFAHIYYYAWEMSAELAQSRGQYPRFDGSPLSRGVLHADTYDTSLEPGLDWDLLRSKVVGGTRHSLITAVMPTASTSQICNNTEACEPLSSNLYVRKTQAGEYVIINKYLVADLKKVGMWNHDVKMNIMKNNGSVNELPIDSWMKKRYKIAYEMSMKPVIQQAIDRQPYIDQSQSLNLFVMDPKIERVSSMHFFAWKGGLKTGMYYLRSMPSTRAQQFVVPVQEAKPSVACRRDNPQGCEACSA